MTWASPPLVSIVVSVYRRTRFLHNAIQSALAQTHPNVEVIVAEDGGSDCAAAIVARFDDPRVRLSRCERNLGEAGNRVEAYRKARGNYYVNLDDDDALCPEFVAKLVQPLESDPAVIVAFCDHFLMRANGAVDLAETEACTKAFGRDRLAPGAHDPLGELGLTSGTIPMNVGAMFRAELIWPNGSRAQSALPVQAAAADDLYLTYLACVSGKSAYYLPERLSEYRVHEGQLTVLRNPSTSYALRFCYGQFLRDHRLRPWRRELRSKLATVTTCLATDLLRMGETAAARRYFAQSLLHRIRLRPVAGLALTLLPGTCPPRALELYRGVARATPAHEEPGPLPAGVRVH